MSLIKTCKCFCVVDYFNFYNKCAKCYTYVKLMNHDNYLTDGGKKYVSNLSTVCLRCLCHASTTCNITVGCQKNYCGPFFLTKEYWREAGRPTLKDDDPDRTNGNLLFIIFSHNHSFNN